MTQQTEKKQIFENLKKIADSIHALFGPNSEVVIHDLVDLQKSLVYMRGDVTGRDVGAPATDLLVKLVQQEGEQLDFFHNYKSVTPDGRCLKSATTIIRDSSGKPVAAFCINLDTSQYFNAIQALLPFIHDLETGKYPSKETYAESPADTIRTLFVRAVEEIGKQPGAMSIEEKTRFIELMKKSGAFQFKGAVSQVAALMDVTKCTVYNYLKKNS
jgi:predicted transcriptional regulator YheO